MIYLIMLFQLNGIEVLINLSSLESPDIGIWVQEKERHRTREGGEGDDEEI